MVFFVGWSWKRVGWTILLIVCSAPHMGCIQRKNVCITIVCVAYHPTCRMISYDLITIPRILVNKRPTFVHYPTSRMYPTWKYLHYKPTCCIPSYELINHPRILVNKHPKYVHNPTGRMYPTWKHLDHLRICVYTSLRIDYHRTYSR